MYIALQREHCKSSLICRAATRRTEHNSPKYPLNLGKSTLMINFKQVSSINQEWKEEDINSGREELDEQFISSRTRVRSCLYMSPQWVTFDILKQVWLSVSSDFY